MRNVKVWIMDETEHWDKSVISEIPGARIMAAYVVDEEMRHFLCEMNPSKHGVFIENQIFVPKNTPEELSRKVREEFENNGYDRSGEDSYFKQEPFDKHDLSPFSE